MSQSFSSQNLMHSNLGECMPHTNCKNKLQTWKTWKQINFTKPSKQDEKARGGARDWTLERWVFCTTTSHVIPKLKYLKLVHIV